MSLYMTVSLNARQHLAVLPAVPECNFMLLAVPLQRVVCELHLHQARKSSKFHAIPQEFANPSAVSRLIEGLLKHALKPGEMSLPKILSARFQSPSDLEVATDLQLAGYLLHLHVGVQSSLHMSHIDVGFRRLMQASNNLSCAMLMLLNNLSKNAVHSYYHSMSHRDVGDNWDVGDD